MRSGLLRFTKHLGVNRYHEAITRFWVVLVKEFLRHSPAVELAAQVNALIRCYPEKDILFEYYSRERVMSDEATHTWVEPDLSSLGKV